MLVNGVKCDAIAAAKIKLYSIIKKKYKYIVINRIRNRVVDVVEDLATVDRRVYMMNIFSSRYCYDIVRGTDGDN